jgi:hypothetical protein
VTRYIPERQLSAAEIEIVSGHAHPFAAASSGIGRAEAGTASARHTTS